MTSNIFPERSQIAAQILSEKNPEKKLIVPIDFAQKIEKAVLTMPVPVGTIEPEEVRQSPRKSCGNGLKQHLGKHCFPNAQTSNSSSKTESRTKK